MVRPIFENFRNALLDYFETEIIAAEFDQQQNLIVFANPYCDFTELIIHVCDNIGETVYFQQQLEMHLYPFGNNEYLKIRIN